MTVLNIATQKHLLRCCPTLFCLLWAEQAFSAPTPPGAEILVWLFAVATFLVVAFILSVTTLLGKGLGGRNGAAKGFAIGLAAISLFVVFVIVGSYVDRRRREANYSEYASSITAACMTGIGERGKAVPISPQRIFVIRSPEHKSYYVTEHFSFEGASEQLKFVDRAPEKLETGDVLIEFDVTFRGNGAGDPHRLVFFTTQVSVGGIGLVAVRTGLSGCTDDYNEDSIERFVRRALATDQPVLRAFKERSSAKQTEYVIASFVGDVQKGRFDISPEVQYVVSTLKCNDLQDA